MRVRPSCAIAFVLFACGTPRERSTVAPVTEPQRSLAPSAVVAATARRDVDASSAVAPSSDSSTLPTPSTGGPDAALFERAEAARRAGDPAAMRAALLVLVRDHPTSPFVPHAYFAFGEFYFAEGRMQDAANLFEKASMFPDSDVVPFAMHRIAWCQVNLGDDQKALQGFMNATRAAKTLPPERARPLAIASVFDSVGPFVRAGKLERAPDFYRRFVDGTGVELDAVLERVVATAVDSGRGDEIVKLCRDAGSPRWCSGGEARPRAPQP